jgi:hypothetical protein
VTQIPPEHTAARALEDSFRVLGQERKRDRANFRQPWRHVSRRLPRAAVAALTGLMLVAVAATGTKVFLGDGGELPADSAGVQGRLTPAPAYRRLAQASARDPIDHRAWGIRTFQSAGGETCLALGRIVGNRLGAVRVGQFKELPARTSGVCGPLERQHLVMTSRVYFDSAIDGGRTVLYGIVDRTVGRLGLQPKAGQGAALPIAADGTFIVVRTGTTAFDGHRLVAEGSAGRQVRSFGP